MRVLVLGAGGLLGAAVAREFGAAHEAVALDRSMLDIGDRIAVDRTMTEVRPEAVINCAAYNDVDAAEENAVAALRVNALAVRALAAASRDAGARFVHYGSDFVFDGAASRPYTEDDAPNPRSVYGASKLLGDWFALEHPSGYLIRVESLFGTPASPASRRGSVDTIIARIRARQPVPVFSDRTASPAHTVDVARATRLLLERRAAPGLYHCVNSGAATWVEIAQEAARLMGLPIELKPITLETAGLKAQRPRYSAMSNHKLHRAGIPMATWQEALATHLLGPGPGDSRVTAARRRRARRSARRSRGTQ